MNAQTEIKAIVAFFDIEGGCFQPAQPFAK